MADSRDEIADRMNALRDREQGERIGRAVGFTAMSVVGYRHALLASGVPEDVANDLTGRFQDIYVSASMAAAFGDDDG